VNLALAWDPLFRLPLVTGLVLALALPLLGGGLRLREQWFSGLGVAQMAAAGGVAGAVLHAPVMLFALLGGLLGGAARALTRRARNEHYAVMLLAGWAGVMLLSLYGHDASMTAAHLLHGQLYFSALPHLLAAIALLIVVLASGRWLSRRLLMARLFPDHFRANRIPAWPHELGFEGLVLGGVVLGISTMGVMATFAMLLVPPWVSFRLVRGWHRALFASVLLGLAAYLLGFMLALALDWPFGPTLVLSLLLLLPLRLLSGRIG
jgi:zinc/manganese transport system permease protein